MKNVLFLLLLLSPPWLHHDSMLFLANAQEIGSSCQQRTDCDSGNCFFGFASEGVCACNTVTNEGCTDGVTACVVDVSETVLNQPPFCAIPTGSPCNTTAQTDCFLQETCCESGICFQEDESGTCLDASVKPIGAKCRAASDCESNNCFYGLQPLDTAGSCQCNLDTDAGCDDGTVCTDVEFFVDEAPFCALPLGSTCSGDEVCETYACLQDRCVCNMLFNAGCGPDEVCVLDDVEGARCQTLGVVLPQPIGAACVQNSDCITFSCFFSGGGQDGVCSCDFPTNSGCSVGETTCSIDINGGPPFCALEDGSVCDVEAPDQSDCFLQEGCCKGTCSDDGTCVALPPTTIGSRCRESADCETDYCFFSILPLGTPGSCQCNTLTNVGCPDDRECTALVFVADGPPVCTFPVGSPCDEEQFTDCDTLVCFEGTCQCNNFFQVGCEDNEVCVGNETDGYSCEPLTLEPIGSECERDSDCETGSCFFGFGEKGVCCCNIESNAGCSVDGSTCVIDITEMPSTLLPPFCGLPDGEACAPPAEDTFCFQQDGCCEGFCSDGGNCEPVVDVQLDAFCREDSDCDSDSCVFAFLPRNSPSLCRCNVDTNGGCAEGRTCTTLAFLLDAPPFCAIPLGAECDTDATTVLDCETTNCFKGTCQCLEGINAGCTGDEICVGDDVEGYECVLPGESTLDPSPAPASPVSTTPVPTTEPPSSAFAANRAVGAAVLPLLLVSLILTQTI